MAGTGTTTVDWRSFGERATVDRPWNDGGPVELQGPGDDAESTRGGEVDGAAGMRKWWGRWSGKRVRRRSVPTMKW